MPIIAGSYIRGHHIRMLCDAQSDVCSGDTETSGGKKRKSNGSLWLPLFMSCIITKPLKAECAEHRKESVCAGSVPSPPELCPHMNIY